MFALASACWEAATGPMPIISGDNPESPVEIMRANGVMPSAFAFDSLITTRAAAPSFKAQQLPAVTVPSGRNTGFNCETPSNVTFGRGPSSLEITEPSGKVTGVMSLAQNPLAIAAWAKTWLRTANSSCSPREMPLSWATFSAV